MKIFEFRFKKKKGKKKSRKDNFPSFFTASWTHTYTPRHPVHDETAHTSLDPTMSAIRRRGNGGAIGRGRTSEVHNWEDRVSEEREGKRERERNDFRRSISALSRLTPACCSFMPRLPLPLLVSRFGYRLFNPDRSRSCTPDNRSSPSSLSYIDTRSLLHSVD